jgi:hypothetical protein
MSPRGAVALGEIAGTLAMLEVGCAWRKRHGRFRLAAAMIDPVDRDHQTDDFRDDRRHLVAV